MKITGVILALVGVVILVASGLMAMHSQSPPGSSETIVGDRPQDWSSLAAAIGGTVVLVTGTLLIVYGGRGWVATSDPSIRS